MVNAQRRPAFGAVPALVQPYLDEIMVDVRAQVRAEAESAAAKGATEALMPYLIGLAGLSGLALLVALVRR